MKRGLISWTTALALALALGDADVRLAFAQGDGDGDVRSTNVDVRTSTCPVPVPNGGLTVEVRQEDYGPNKMVVTVVAEGVGAWDGSGTPVGRPFDPPCGNGLVHVVGASENLTWWPERERRVVVWRRLDCSEPNVARGEVYGYCPPIDVRRPVAYEFVKGPAYGDDSVPLTVKLRIVDRYGDYIFTFTGARSVDDGSSPSLTSPAPLVPIKSVPSKPPIVPAGGRP